MCLHAELLDCCFFVICADNYNFPVQVDWQCRSEKWEVFLYGDKTISTKRTLGVSACSMTGSAASSLFAPTTTTSRFELKGQCRSEKWEVYLYGYSRFKL